MANYDILATAAGKFQPTLLDQKKQKTLLVLAKLLNIGSGDAANVAAIQAIVNRSETAFLGIPFDRPDLNARANAIWWSAAETLLNSGLAVPGVTTNTRLSSAVSAYLMNLDDNTLNKLELFAEGRFLQVLT